MPNVEFSEEKEFSNPIDAKEKTVKSAFSSLPIKMGLAKDETGAAIIFIGVGITALIAAIAVFLSAV